MVGSSFAFGRPRRGVVFDQGRWCDRGLDRRWLSSVTDQPAFPSRASTRSALPDNIAANPASRTFDFQTKPSIVLDQIRKAVADGIPPGVVLADASYGADMKFQAGLLKLDLDYIVGIQPNSSVWTDGRGPLSAKTWNGRPNACNVQKTTSSSWPRTWLCRCRHPPGRT